MKKYLFIAIALVAITSCTDKKQAKVELVSKTETPFVWENANIYFLMVDRFNNGNVLNQFITSLVSA